MGTRTVDARHGECDALQELGHSRIGQLRVQLLQRVHFRVHVGPLSMIETAEYIDHRLRVAGWEGEQGLFPASTMPSIYRYTGGVPRLINTLCDTVMTAAYVADTDRIDDDIVAEAVRELDWEPYALRRRSTDRRTFVPSDGPKPKLVLLREGEILSRYTLTERRLLIGRDADNDVPVASEFISRHHAQISYYRGSYWVMDLKSTNGTFVNGQRVRRKRLADKDVIALGQHRLVFQDPVDGRADDDEPDKTTHLSDFQGTSVLDPSYSVKGAPPAEDDEAESEDSDQLSAG